ncbi:hypothetical protein EC991_004101 [Linnemannia zychae]|nr:hypothetical protein EC991_004101 [Linnemannia zychae]
MPSSAMFVKSRESTIEGEQLGFVKLMVAGQSRVWNSRLIQDMFRWEGVIANDFDDEFLQEQDPMPDSDTSGIATAGANDTAASAIVDGQSGSGGVSSNESSSFLEEAAGHHQQQRKREYYQQQGQGVREAVVEHYASSMILPAWARAGFDEQELHQEILVKNICMVPYSPLKPNIDAYPVAFGAGESPMMSTINPSAAAARSAKVKSDLLMGLNSGIRPDRLSMKDQPQQARPPSGLSEEHSSILNSLNGGMRMTSPANSHIYSNNPSGGDYTNRPSSQYEGLSMNNAFGGSGLNASMMPMSMAPSSGSGVSISGPPPGLGMPPNSGNSGSQGGGNNPNNRPGSYTLGGGDNDNGPSSYAPGMGGMGLNNMNKPMDITSMMSALDFFGPSSSGGNSSGTLANNWSMPNGNTHHPSYLQQQHLLHLQQGLNSPTNSSNGQGAPGLGSRRESAQSNASVSINGGQQQPTQQQLQQYQQQLQQQQQQQQHQQQQQQPQQQQQQQQQSFNNGFDQGGNSNVNNNNNSTNTSNGNSNNTSEVNTAQSTPHLSNNAAAANATARSVEDLELQVINAKMETQMLENQLNAVIKRNRRKLYA